MTRVERRGPLTALLVAQGVSVTGNRIALLAIPWFVLQTTGSAAQTGVAAAMNTVPVIVAGLLAGPLIERVGYRRTSVLADLSSGVTIACIPLLEMTGHLSYPVLLVIVFCGALLDAPGETARRSLLPEVADHGGVSIDRAASLHETTYRTTQLVGATLAGVLIAVVGAPEALLIDAATFAVSAGLVGFFVRAVDARPSPEDHASAGAGYIGQLTEAWRFLVSHRLLRSVVAVFVGANILEAALVTVLLPILADEVYDSAVVLGVMVGAVGGGALVGVALHATVADRFSRRAMLVPALLLAGGPKYLLLAAFPPAAVAVVGIAVLAIALGPVNPISGAIEFELVPKAMRGRLFGLLGTAFTGTAPVGAIGAGVLTEIVGLRGALIAGGVLYTLVTLVPAMHPAWRNLEGLTAGDPR